VTTLLVVGNDRIGARSLRMLDLHGSDVVVAVDLSGGIGRVLRLVCRGRIHILDVLRMALAEVRRPPRGIPPEGALSFANNDELCDLMGSVSPDRVVMFRAGLVVSRKVFDIGVPILNIQCARVPEYGGLNAVQRALRDGAVDQMATMHRVVEEVDGGEVVDVEPFTLELNRGYFHNEETAYAAGTRLLARTLGKAIRDERATLWFVRRVVVPALLAVASTVLATWREVQGLARQLTAVMSPAELIALRNNPLLETTGFSSGSEITGVSLPLRAYRLLDWMGVGALDAARVMVAVEALVFFVLVAMAVRVVLPRVTLALAASTATVATVGYALSGTNLANWGFFFGWNYGFAYALACLVLAHGLRQGWTSAAVWLALLVTVHSLVAVLVGLALVPLFVADVVRRRIVLRWRPIVVAGLLAVGYLLVERDIARLSSGVLDTEAYIARLRAFQFHLFFRFDLDFLSGFSRNLGPWFVAVVALLAASLALQKRTEADLAQRLLVVVATVSVLSVAGWAHSGLDAPNTTLLLVALHRSSLFVSLLVLTVAVPLLLEDMRSARRLPFVLPMLVWLLLPGHVIRSILGLLVLVGLLGWIAANARGNRNVFVAVLASTAAVATCGALWFLLDDVDAYPGLGQLAGYVTGDGGMVVFLVLLALLGAAAFAAPSATERFLAPVATRSVLMVVAVLLFTGTAIFDNPRMATGERGAKMSDYAAVQQWVRGNTPTDAVFLLPLGDWGFGWKVFSERASVGKPREWLHYSFLYSRDQTTMAEGTKRANMLGIDVDDWFEEHPGLGKGSLLVREMADRFDDLTDEQVVRLGAELGADHFVFEQGHNRGSNCFTTRYENAHFTVAVAVSGCDRAEG
jgi:hypothetical protein